jgi:hypothetical protein
MMKAVVQEDVRSGAPLMERRAGFVEETIVEHRRPQNGGRATPDPLSAGALFDALPLLDVDQQLVSDEKPVTCSAPSIFEAIEDLEVIRGDVGPELTCP